MNNNSFSYSYTLRLLTIVFCTLLILSSCSSARKAKKAAAKNAELGQLISKTLQEQAFLPEVFKTKAKIRYASPAFSQNFSVDIRMRKDSLIWMTAYPNLVKIPVGYALITPDSVKVIDRLNKRAYLKDIAYAEQLLGYPVDFYSLQNIILGNMPLTPSHHPRTKYNKDLNEYELSYEESPIDVILTVPIPKGTQFDIDKGKGNAALDTPFQISKVALIDSVQNRQLHMEQGDFRPLANQTFSHERKIVVTGAVEASAKINFERGAIPEKTLKYPFPLKRTYEINR